MKYPNLYKELQLFGKDFVNNLKAELIKFDKVATGDLINSISYKIIDKGERWEVDIIANNYLDYVDKGRRPGAKQPPSNKLVPWVESKGIKIMGEDGEHLTTKTIAFIIAQSIGKKGIKATDVIRIAEEITMADHREKIKIAIAADEFEIVKNELRDLWV